MKTVLVCAAWSGGAVLAELGLAYLLLYCGGDRVCHALVDINT